jgi:lysophospholipase L1-like esterase
MPRRWAAAVAVLLTLVASACKDPGAAGQPGPTGTPPAVPRGDLPSSMVSLGDSLTAGYGACLAPVACPRNSWATGDGTLVNSHYRRILAGNPAIGGHARNVAVPGATVADLPGQAAAATQSTVDYVTVLIGGNDACRAAGIDAMTPVPAFRAELDRALATLKAGLPRARLLVVSIPDVYRLWEVGHTRKFVTELWAHGVCPPLLANATSTAPADAARRQRFRERIDAYDGQLAQACAAYGPRCRFDGGAAHGVAFGLDLLSALDFFHPSAAGQNELARVTYPGRFTW